MKLQLHYNYNDSNIFSASFLCFSRILSMYFNPDIVISTQFCYKSKLDVSNWTCNWSLVKNWHIVRRIHFKIFCTFPHVLISLHHNQLKMEVHTISVDPLNKHLLWVEVHTNLQYFYLFHSISQPPINPRISFLLNIQRMFGFKNLSMM